MLISRRYNMPIHLRLLIGVVIITLFIYGGTAALAARDDDAPAIPLLTWVETPLHDSEGLYETGLGIKMILHVQNLDVLMKKAEAENQKLVLYIDGMAIPGLYPLSIDSENEDITFVLKRTNDSHDVWATLLGSPNTLERPISLTVGFETGYTILSGVKNLELIFIPQINIICWSILAIVLLISILYISIKTPILRMEGMDSPYSLARAQMMLWTYIVVIAYLFIWIVIKEFNTIPGSILALLGISITTAAGSVYIDAGKRTTHNKLMAEKDALAGIIEETENNMANLDTSKLYETQNDLNDKKIRLSILHQRISEFPIVKESELKSRGLFKDLLSDSNGYSLHRLQMFVWTLILAIIFFNSVYTTLAMPEFDMNLLALMGISSGVYIGFKFPEK